MESNSGPKKDYMKEQVTQNGNITRFATQPDVNGGSGEIFPKHITEVKMPSQWQPIAVNFIFSSPPFSPQNCLRARAT